jgi:protein-arginine kinase activator protein McsA
MIFSHLELNRASEMGTHEKRIVAITNACAEFDHAEDSKHNVELQNGAANVLTKILSITDDEDEIRMVCAATEMVFRAQMTYVHIAFDKCGTVMMRNLLRIMERAESGKMKHAGTCIQAQRYVCCP